MGSIKLRDVTAIADHADTTAHVRLEIHVGRWRDERQHLAVLVDKGELWCTWAA